MTKPPKFPAFSPLKVLFSYGFRAFFLGAALWAALAMAVWIAMLGGWLALPVAFDPVAWHAHAFLFGYLGAVLAGFLLTAVPNWTGRAPITGWPLALLFGLWLLGRVGSLMSAWWPVWSVAALDLAFLAALALATTHEIIAARNWRNLPVVGVLGVFIFAEALVYADLGGGAAPAHGVGFRLGLASGVMLIGLIGGRIVPVFTRNWLAKRGAERLPTPPGQGVDKASLALLGVALLLWTRAPAYGATALMLLLAGGLHVIRLARWQGGHTAAEPLVWVLHMGYAFVPLGALAQAASILAPARFGAAGALHLWMVGAIGLMTLAVMTRATLGHTGRALRAGRGTAVLYLCLIGAVAARVLAGVWLAVAQPLLVLAGLLWIAAFGGFALLYGPALLRPREEG